MGLAWNVPRALLQRLVERFKIVEAAHQFTHRRNTVNSPTMQQTCSCVTHKGTSRHESQKRTHSRMQAHMHAQTRAHAHAHTRSLSHSRTHQQTREHAHTRTHAHTRATAHPCTLTHSHKRHEPSLWLYRWQQYIGLPAYFASMTKYCQSQHAPIHPAPAKVRTRRNDPIRTRMS